MSERVCDRAQVKESEQEGAIERTERVREAGRLCVCEAEGRESDKEGERG